MASVIENYKNLPAATKRLLTGGVILGLFVALPLFLYAVLNGNFDIRNKAASGEVSGEPIPTPTIPATTGTPEPTPVATILLPTPSLKPTPTSIACARALQTVTISPDNQEGSPGDTLKYLVSVVNNDSPTCANSTFTFTPLVPFKGWTVLNPPPVQSSPGSHGQIPLEFTSSKDTPQGSVPIGITVTGPAGSVSASATYTVLGIASPAYGGLVNNGSFETNLDADRIPDLWIWGRTTQPTSLEGIVCDENHLDGNCSLGLAGGLFSKVVSQKISITGDRKTGLTLEVFSKADNARGPGRYAVKVEFYNKGKRVARSIFNFKGGTHDFQRIAKNIKSNRAYDEIVVSLIYNKAIGMAWFDNVTLKVTGQDVAYPASTNSTNTVVDFIQDLFGFNSNE